MFIFGRCNEKNFSLPRLAEFETLALLKLPKSAGAPPPPPQIVAITSTVATITTVDTLISMKTLKYS
jgi:hypothetical protein